MWAYLCDHALEILGVVLGLIYLWQELKASDLMWITSIVMPIVSLFVYYRAGLYADFGIDIYYVLIAIYGYAAWRWGSKDKKKLPISKTPARSLYWLVPLFAVLFVGIAMVLKHWTNSTVPWADSFTTSLSIVALLMLARKWLEQWWVWFVVDAACTALYIYKGIPFYAGLYALYTILAVYGYYRWKRMMEKEAEAA